VDGGIQIGMFLPFCGELQAQGGFLFLAQRQHAEPRNALDSGPFMPRSLTYRPADLHQLFHPRPGRSTSREFFVTIDSFQTLERSCHDD
jgi:hypothetical protein